MARTLGGAPSCAKKERAEVQSSLLLEYQRAETHAAGRCNRREESRESGYYNLHRNLNETLFHLYTSFLWANRGTVLLLRQEEPSLLLASVSG